MRYWEEGTCLVCGELVSILYVTIRDKWMGEGIATYGELCDECEAKLADEMLPKGATDETAPVRDMQAGDRTQPAEDGG